MVRLPQNVIKAKEAFESENKITNDIISNPRQILKETPAGAIFEYSSITVAVLCQKKLLAYNAYALTARCALLAVSPTLNLVAQKVAGALSVYSKGLAKFPQADFNAYNGAFSNGGETSSIPECLTASDVISDILSDIAKEIKKLFKNLNFRIDFGAGNIIDEIVSKIRSQVKKVKEKISEFTKPLIDLAKQIVDFVKKVFDTVLTLVQKALFVIFDTITTILDKLGFGKLISKLREIYDCLKSNCPPAVQYMVDMEDVMPGMVLNLPLDQYTGEFRVYKLSMYSDMYPDLTTSDGAKVLYDMDSDYCEYRETIKREIERNKYGISL